MGTTLTGTTPQDTYDSLIKVTDNGPLSGSLKTLTDGLGNDSALALSTGGASITGTLAVSSTSALNNTVTITGPNVGNSSLIVRNANNANSGEILLGGTTFGSRIIRDSVGADQDLIIVNSHGTPQGFKFRTGATTAGTTDLMVITGAGNVGIGTSSPTSLLNLSSATPILTLNQTTANSEQGIDFDFSDTNYAYIRANSLTGLVSYAAGLTGGAGYFHRFIVDGSERFRITPNGVTFNGDTAAANALDDYEEGTWTPVFRGGTTAGTYTYDTTVSGGSYRKIGSQVTVWGSIVDIQESSAGTGIWEIAGLPFTIGNNLSFVRGNGNLYVRQSAAARSSLTILFSNNGTSLYPSYSNGSSDAVQYTIAADYTAMMDIGFVITYFV